VANLDCCCRGTGAGLYSHCRQRALCASAWRGGRHAAVHRRPARTRPPGSVIIGAAGDIACPPVQWHKRHSALGMDGTAKVLEAIQPDAVLTLGDNQYPSGALADFQASYAETWGAYRSITFPVPGKPRIRNT